MADRSSLDLTPIYIGIDPGQEGGITAICGPQVMAVPMPDSDVELFTALREMQRLADGEAFGCLERVSASPQMGVTSAFTFGKGYGRLSYALTAAGIPFDLVNPQKWQGALGIPKRKSHETQPQFKHRLRLVAHRLFPNYPLWKEPRTLGKQLAVCDSMLIAQYCQRLHHTTKCTRH